ncbi:hypothetical protein ACXPVS_10235 [Pseudomonas sp. Ma2-10]
MKAVWNAKVGFGIMSWAVVSYAVTTAMFTLIFFPFLPLVSYLAGWPFGLSVLISIMFFVICNFAKRDHKVSISIVPEGLSFRDEAAGYERQDLIRYEDIQSIRVRRNPFFRSLVINLKERNQRFSLSNVLLPENFLAGMHAHIDVKS